jgi:glycosyltransferase involved in cell wall biosynthesis
MRIGFDAKRAFNNSAGLGNFSRNTLHALAQQDPDTKQFLFSPSANHSLFNLPENATVINPNGLWWKTFPNAWRSVKIAREAEDLKLDVFHGLSHELPIGIEYSGIKTVVTIHDLIYLRFPEYFNKIDRAIYDRKFRYACQVATKIHAISEQTKYDLISYYNIPEEKIEVIYQSINPLFFDEVDEALKKMVRQKYHLPERFLLTVGTIEPRKNLMGLLEGMLTSRIDLPLVVVGKSTDYRKKAQQLIDSRPKELKVFFLTGVNDNELHALYQSAEAMIYPSFFEGFGLPIVEAQASGCPVITSNISSMPEAGANAAIYVDPEKPWEIGRVIETLLNSSAIAGKMIEKGIENAQLYTPDHYARQLINLYKNILND